MDVLLLSTRKCIMECGEASRPALLGVRRSRQFDVLAGGQPSRGRAVGHSTPHANEAAVEATAFTHRPPKMQTEANKCDCEANGQPVDHTIGIGIYACGGG